MRYLGQEHTITIGVPSGDGRVTVDVEEIRTTFKDEYQKTFGHIMDEEVEIVSVRATLRTPLPRRAAESFAAAASTNGTGGTVKAYSFTKGDWLDFAIFQRANIGTESVKGPAIVLEETATTYIDAEFEAHAHESGSLFINDTKEA